MNPAILLKGIILGFSIAAPVGPIGILCIRRTLNEGMFIGFASGLGAATADAIYGSIAAFGLTVISTFLIKQQLLIHTLGSLFLLYIGWKTLRTIPRADSICNAGQSVLMAYASTFLLTITNPMTILSFTAVFAGLSTGVNQENYNLTILMVIGIFTGSMLWWLLLSSGVNALRYRFNLVWLQWVNRLAGLIIIGFAFYNFSQLFF
jgi:threonine/homoserine/homoserine lactone efflux protein